MNKRYNIKIPIKFEIEGVEELTKALKINVNTMLNPFYISETSLLSLFMDEEEYEKFHPKARELIFNASLRASEFSYGKLRGFSEEHKLLLKRELTLCLVINSFAKHFNKGFELSHQRSKSFAEFSVSTTVKNSPALLEDMIKNSNSCVTEAKKAINDLSQVAASLGAMNLKVVGTYLTHLLLDFGCITIYLKNLVLFLHLIKSIVRMVIYTRMV